MVENFREIQDTFDLNEPLDEAIFLAICGRNLCKENSCLTGVVRLEIANNLLEQVIKKINLKLDNELERIISEQ